MRFLILLTLFLVCLEPFVLLAYESHDDILIQCSRGLDNQSKRRDRHICEKDNFDDDFEYHISSMETLYSSQKFLCISFEKNQESKKIKFKLWFSHEKFIINAFGVKQATPSKGVFESSVISRSASIVIIPTGNSDIPQIFGFELNGQDACPFCGQRLQSAIGLVNQGAVVNNHYKYPWHMTIYHYESTNLQYKCGGSLIRDNKILTAAHCVTNKDQNLHENKLIVRFEEGGKLLNSPKYQYKVLKSYVHELYNHETFENDIALLVLETSIDILTSRNIRAVCLPSPRMKVAGLGFVVGFGSTDRHLNASRVLMETELSIIPDNVCLDSDPSFFSSYLFKTNFCAGKKGTGVCSGDSGGGLFTFHEGLWKLIGIVSNTKINKDPSVVNPTCSDETYALFTNVAKYSDWIEKRIYQN